MEITTFSHLSVYIKYNSKTDTALAVLKQAIPQLDAAQAETQYVARHKQVMESAAFAVLMQKADLFTIDARLLPEDTPESYHHVTFETLQPVAPNKAVLSIPISHVDADRIDDVIYGELKPVLLNLFGRDVFKINRLSARSDQSFYLDRVNETIYEQKTGWRRLLAIFQPR